MNQGSNIQRLRTRTSQHFSSEKNFIACILLKMGVRTESWTAGRSGLEVRMYSREKVELFLLRRRTAWGPPWPRAPPWRPACPCRRRPRPRRRRPSARMCTWSACRPWIAAPRFRTTGIRRAIVSRCCAGPTAPSPPTWSRGLARRARSPPSWPRCRASPSSRLA